MSKAQDGVANLSKSSCCRTLVGILPWVMVVVGLSLLLRRLFLPGHTAQFVFGVILLLGGLLWLVPELQVWYHRDKVAAKDVPSLVDQHRRTLAKILGGAILVASPYVAWHEVQIAREGQIATRLDSAVKQLYDSRASIGAKLGAIRVLQQIADDSPKYHWRAIEHLADFVRVHADWKDPGTPSGEDADESVILVPEAAVQAALTAIGRRKLEFERRKPRRLDLTETDLRNAQLWMMNFAGADLSNSHLEGANLIGSCLEGAYLQGVHLAGTQLNEADLKGVVFGKGADLTGANLYGTDLTEVDLQGVEGLTREQIGFAITDGATLPDYLR